MVKNKFAVMTLTSLALTLNAGVVRAEDDAMFSMDDGFSADSIFDVDAEQNAQQSNNAGAEVAKDTSVASDKASENVGFAQDNQEDPFAAMSASLEGDADAKEKEKQPAADSNTENAATGAAEVSTIDNLDDMDAFSKMQGSKNEKDGSSVADRILGSADNSVFKEMAAIERETALLELKVKRERLLSEIENSKASLRRNQLEELERREQITRNRINWEVEQEQAAKRSELELEQTRREMERQERLEKQELAEAAARKLAEATAAKKQQETTDADTVAAGSGTVAAAAPAEEDITSLYTIEEVRGVGGELYATLISDNGTINVREGYPLKGGYKVSKVTTSFVEVKRGDKVELLRFASKGAMSN